MSDKGTEAMERVIRRLENMSDEEYQALFDATKPTEPRGDERIIIVEAREQEEGRDDA
jgi:hypothetical protein